VTPTADHRFDVMSLTKAMTGCTFLKMSKDLENTNWEFVLNQPLQDVIPALANTKYKLIKKTGGTEQLTLPTDSSSGLVTIGALDPDDGGTIVKTITELFKRVTEEDESVTSTSIASGTLMSKAKVLSLSTSSTEADTPVVLTHFTTNVGYVLEEQRITIGDCLAECAGQDLLHIAPWKFHASDGEHVSKQGSLFDYNEMVQILNAAGQKLPATPPPDLMLAGSTNYPDQHGLANITNTLITDTDPAKVQTVFLTGAVKAPSYGRATNVVAFYMVQQMYAKRMNSLPEQVNVFESPFDIEDLLFKHFCAPLNIESRMTLRRLVDPDLIDVGGIITRATAPLEHEISPAQPATYLDSMMIPLMNFFRSNADGYDTSVFEMGKPAWDAWSDNYFSILGKRIPTAAIIEEQITGSPYADFEWIDSQTALGDAGPDVHKSHYWIPDGNIPYPHEGYRQGKLSTFLYASGVGMAMTSNEIAKWARMMLKRGVTDEGTEFMNFSLWNRWMFGRTVPQVGSEDSQRINRYFGAAVGLPEAPERFLHGMYTDDNNLINYSIPAVPVNTFGQAGSFATRFVVNLDQDLFQINHFSIFQKDEVDYQDEVKRLHTICNTVSDVTSPAMRVYSQV
jgi:hypothetical protein